MNLKADQEKETFKELLHLTHYSLVNTGLGLYPEIMSLKPSPLHHRLSDALVNSKSSTVMAFPREFGKSTFVWEFMSSWNILHCKFRYIMYVASTATIAEDQMMNIRTAITSHPILKSIIKIKKETKNQLFYSIAGESYFIAAYGSGQQLRGKRYERFRPDLVIMDDIEDTESVRSEDQRKHLKDWFWADVVPLGKDARFFFVGTMLHEDCLLANLIEQPPMEWSTGEVWKTFRYGVLDDDSGEPTWPEKFSLDWIEMTRKKYIANGMLYRFDTEYMNIAVSRGSRVFDPQQVRFYSIPQLEAARRGGFDVITVVDPGIHPDGDHDPTVILTSAMDSNGNMWILNVVRERLVHHKILDAIVKEYRAWNPRQLFLESVQGQAYLLQDLEHGSWPGGSFINAKALDSKQVRLGKARVLSLESLFHQRKLFVPATATWWVDFCAEMVSYPKGKHDDILDAMSYAKLNHVQLATTTMDYGTIINRRSSTVF